MIVTLPSQPDSRIGECNERQEREGESLETTPSSIQPTSCYDAAVINTVDSEQYCRPSSQTTVTVRHYSMQQEGMKDDTQLDSVYY